jgi:hypothetical protein
MKNAFVRHRHRLFIAIQVLGIAQINDRVVHEINVNAMYDIHPGQERDQGDAFRSVDIPVKIRNERRILKIKPPNAAV